VRHAGPRRRPSRALPEPGPRARAHAARPRPRARGAPAPPGRHRLWRPPGPARPGASPDGDRLLHALAEARLATLDADLEDFLDVTFPDHLSFDKPEDRQWHPQRLRTWLDKTEERGVSHLGRGDPARRRRSRRPPRPWLPAPRRGHRLPVGVLSRQLAAVLGGAKVPEDLRNDPALAADLTDAFCAQLAEYGTAFAERAGKDFTACAERAKAAGDAAWQARCEQALDDQGMLPAK